MDLNLPTFGGQQVTLCHDIHDRRLIHAKTTFLSPCVPPNSVCTLFSSPVPKAVRQVADGVRMSNR
jgi:hypothetical protein